MSLQRRLLIALLICAPLVWAVALLASARGARDEIDELFDTEIVHVARQMQATIGSLHGELSTDEVPPDEGEADLRDLAVAIWDAQGQRRLADREGVQLPRRPDAQGFTMLQLDGEPWRVYYLHAPGERWLIATGQRLRERDELLWSLLGSQMLPWLLVLPVLLVAMAFAVRQALAPLRRLADELRGRGADDLQPVQDAQAPAELRPLLTAMNGLFGRIDATLARERRFTADAAHELRTPLAVLRAQWDVVRHARDAEERGAAEARLNAGLDRLDRLVTQMLALSRLEAMATLARPEPLDWPALVEQAMGDVLPLAERRRIELACEGEMATAWPPRGDPALMAVLLRNLLDNAVRYAPLGSTVTLRLAPDALQVENAGPPLPPESLAHLGERFRRRDGQAENGSGLGVSIVLRIAALHRACLHYGTGVDGSGVVARLSST